MVDSLLDITMAIETARTKDDFINLTYRLGEIKHIVQELNDVVADASDRLHEKWQRHIMQIAQDTIREKCS